MKNIKLTRTLGIATLTLGIGFLATLAISTYNTLTAQPEINTDIDPNSRYISLDNLDTANLPEGNSESIPQTEIIQDEVVPEKQGVITEDSSRQIIKVDGVLTDEKQQELEEEYGVTFTQDQENNGVYVINTDENSNTEGLTEEIDATVETDIPVKMAADTIDWGISRIGANSIWTESTGSGIKVAVIDTGVQITHPDLSSNITTGYDFVNNDTNPSDDNGHGTHVSGIIAAVQNQSGTIGASHNAKIMPVKVLNADGYGYLSDVAKGIYYAADNGARIINMSLGATTDSLILRDAVNYAARKGVLVVSAAGNNSGQPCTYPAAYSNSICVVATDNNNKLASFSNLGGELAAPGVSNYSTYLGSTYRYLSGTSMATPHVSGAAAILMSECTDCTTSEIRTLLRDSAVDLGEAGNDIIFGYGLVDLVSAMKILNPEEEETPTETPDENPVDTPEENTEPIKEKDITQTVQITFPEETKNKRYIPSEYEDITLEFSLFPIVENSNISKIEVSLDNEIVYTTQKQEDEYELTLEVLDTSQHWIRVTAYFDDHKKSTDSIIIDLTQFKTTALSNNGRGKSVLGISTYVNWLFR